MPENIEDNDILSRMNNVDDTDELTEEGKKVAMLLDTISKNPKLLDEDTKLKEFYDLAIKAKDGKIEGDRIIIKDNLEKVNLQVQEEFGYDTIEDLIEASKTWKKGSDTFDQWNTLINTAPQSLATAISLYLQGNQDWNKAIAVDTKIDFTKPVNNQSKIELVKFYFPNQFTDDELKGIDSTDDEGLKRSIRLAEGFFDREHKNFSDNIKRATENQTKTINAQKQALDKNKDALKKKYPNLTDTQATKLISSLTNGSYARHFLNQDGIFTDKAAENLVALEMPDFYVKNIIGKSREELNKERMEILNRSSDNPTLKGRVKAPSQEKAPDDITRSLLAKRNTYTTTPFKQQ